jgi:septum formation protein
MLEAAGLDFEAVPSSVDEYAVRESLGAGDAIEPADVAEILARAKAEDISSRRPDAVVIGADQVLALEGRILTKPESIADARAMLLELRGHTHQLHSAVCLAQAGEISWSHVDTAHLGVRTFSPSFLEDYLARTGVAALRSAGAYEIERNGVQLFDSVEGDYFTILGLPLIPLLGRLRTEGLLPS